MQIGAGTGNRIGTDGNGINDVAERNIISGNNFEGVLAGGPASIIAGNYIGTDVTGTFSIGNRTGVKVHSYSTNTRVGTDSNGSSDDIEGNLISGNNSTGVIAQGSGTIISGNYIGTDASGTNALGNITTGIQVYSSNIRIGTDGDGINDDVERNIISANGHEYGLGGIYITNSNVTVAGNYIGTDITGTNGLGNSPTGIHIYSSSSCIILSNTIAYNNYGEGILVCGSSATQNKILQNSIFSNSNLGIDLGNSLPGDGVTLNDPGDGDMGANNLQNFPVITTVNYDGVNTTIIGTINSTANTNYDIEVFGNTVRDPSGFGEGEIYLGTVNSLTDGTGNGTWVLVVPGDVTNLVFSSTATDPIGNTSEFSATFVTNPPPSDILLSNDNVNENSPAGTLIGTLSAVDHDPEETFIFSEVLDPDSKFAVVGEELLVDGDLDFEIATSYEVTIRVTDSGNEIFDKLFTITVNDVNEGPTDILLSNDNIDENSALGTVIGTLSANDPDAGETFTFEEVLDPDNKFAVVGDELLVDGDLDFETVVSHEVTIRVTDNTNLTFEKLFTISVNNINEPPIANAGPDQTIEGADPAGTIVTLNGSGSSDPENDPLTYTWSKGGVITFGPTTSQIADVTLTLGIHIIELLVDDGIGGTDTDELTVTLLGTGTISGTVSINGEGVESLTVKLLDDLDPTIVIAEIETDAFWAYIFNSVPVGTYQVMIVEPLGYHVNQNFVIVEMTSGIAITVDFILTEFVLLNEARSKGYWKHQFDVYVNNRGNAQETEADLITYIERVDQYYTPYFPIFAVEVEPGVFVTRTEFDYW